MLLGMEAEKVDCLSDLSDAFPDVGPGRLFLSRNWGHWAMQCVWKRWPVDASSVLVHEQQSHGGRETRSRDEGG